MKKERGMDNKMRSKIKGWPDLLYERLVTEKIVYYVLQLSIFERDMF
ncbi:hypothetical protein KTT_17620 [Tengunoibacter tsumagoiensis]|uniref:Uncharacterized protein n=1 Tax=Tengunoibacter tsumagoiensis TaxID=2014871 RepID=A0A401ZYJ5_9CHLR|nr:hypothetical protein KTT_17620 [Tengunoibacter tsumagoiensis]